MTSKTLILEVPFPPSVNTYWQFNGSRRFLTKSATQFKGKVRSAYLSANHQGFGTQRLMVRIELYPPDRRVRDIDNYAKSLIDALCQANIFVDDEQIDLLTIVRMEQKLGGCCKVAIAVAQND
jgi:crossover junction endodeoxyribonuclease RusA